MNRVVVIAALSAIVALPVAVQAETSGGSRQAAGGVHNSTYIDHHNHDPHSSWSQSAGTGQILGAPMLHENAGAPTAARRKGVHPHWARGTVHSRHGN